MGTRLMHTYQESQATIERVTSTTRVYSQVLTVNSVALSCSLIAQSCSELAAKELSNYSEWLWVKSVNWSMCRPNNSINSRQCCSLIAQNGSQHCRDGWELFQQILIEKIIDSRSKSAWVTSVKRNTNKKSPSSVLNIRIIIFIKYNINSYNLYWIHKEIAIETIKRL